MILDNHSYCSHFLVIDRCHEIQSSQSWNTSLLWYILYLTVQLCWMDHSTTKKNNIDSFDTYVCIYHFYPFGVSAKLILSFSYPLLTTWLLRRLFECKLTHYMPVLPSYRNQSIDLMWKSIDWFLYEGNTGNLLG